MTTAETLSAPSDAWAATDTPISELARLGQALKALRVGRLVFTPRQGGYDFAGDGTASPVIAGAVVSKAMVAPTGFGSEVSPFRLPFKGLALVAT